MDKTQIQYFLAVCQEKNITKAAAKLFLSPQGLNKAIAALEKELGMTLFEKGRFGAELTESGLRLHETARRFAAQYQAFEEEVALLQEEANSMLTVGFAGGMSMMLQEDFFSRYFRERPQVRVRMYSYDSNRCAQEILNNRINVGLCPAPIDPEKLQTHHCLRGKLFLAVGKGHRLAERKSVRLEELRGENLITIDTTTNNQPQIRRLCSLNGVTPNLIFSPADRPLTMELVASGVAVTFNAGNIHKISPKICRVELEDVNLTHEFHLVTIKGAKLGPAAQDFLEYSLNRLKEQEASDETKI